LEAEVIYYCEDHDNVDFSILSACFGKPEDIAEMALFLCSDKAGFITGENICIDGGMTKLMIYHGEHGWEFKA